jgi:TP901 family phage tail tape measure protein
MAMNDDSMVKIMESLGLDYRPAERATKAFESKIASLNKQLFDLKANAIKGAGDINKMFSSQLGQMAGSKMILDQYGQPLKVLNDKVASSFDKATVAANKHAHAVHGAAQEYNIFASEWQRRSQWFLSGTLFYGTLTAARETAQTISEVEMGVTEIARVMEDETFVFKDYRDELLQFGIDYGQTFDTVQDIALRWAQAGYNVKDSLENTKTSLLALNVAELDAKNATESLIGIMAQWQLNSSDLPLVLDKINKTADDFTVTSQDLVDGLLRSSGAAKIMGLSLDQTISLLTVMREASGRTGREVGNALNSILSYVQRPIAIKTLEGLGIQMFTDKAKTQFRNVMEIFKDITAKWDTNSKAINAGFLKATDGAEFFSEEMANSLGLQEEWNDLQKRDISQSTAGVYRRNYFIGMIERMAGAQNVLNGMTDAAGYSQAENARTMDTLQKKYTSLLAAAQELAVALGDAGLLDALKGATDLAKDAADRFADLDDETKALVVTALELVAAVTALKSVMGLFTTKNLIFAGAEGAKSVLGLLPGWGKLLALIVAVTGAVGLYAYNQNKASAQSIEDSLKNVNAKQNEVDQTNKLLQKYQELEGKAVQNNEVKSEMLDIQRQLASIYPDYVDGLDGEGNKLITNIPLLREMNALKQQELELERQKIMMDAKTRLPQLDAEQKRLQDKIDKNKQRLSSGDTTSSFTWRGLTTTKDLSSQIRKEIIEDLGKLSANQLEQQMIDSVINGAGLYDPSTDTLSGKDLRRKLASGGTPNLTTPYNPNDGEKPSSSYSNEPLQDALQLLQHKKQMNEISLQDEISYLRNVRDKYVQTGEERMDIEEKIYTAEKALKDKTLQDSINWINEKKALGELSAEQEIAAWNRVLTNQKNNIEAVKEATQNLYRLQKELREQEVQENKDSLKDLQNDIKDSYDERIDLIEKEKDAKVKAIEDELEALDRDESEYDYDKKMADLEEQLAYWSVRTGEEARKNLADIREQIAEAEHDREVELQKQGLEDEKDAIEDAADEEKEKWEAAYKDMEKAFEDHNLDIIAQAATYSKEAYQQWYDNYIVPMQQALQNGDAEGFDNAVGGIGGSIGNLPSHDYDMAHEDYIAMMANKDRWWELFNAGNIMSSNSEMQRLNELNDELRNKYGIPAGEYPAFHSGGQSLTAGWAQVIPGEFFFPPDLSKDLKTLIAVSSGITGKVANGDSYSTTDNRKQVNLNGPLLNVENMNMEDEIDGEILSRQLNRAVLSLV